MIYLIGWPPKCGKTTLAKTFSKSVHIPWVSTDTLQCIAIAYINDEDYARDFPASQQRCKTNDEKYLKFSSEEILDAYRKQAKSVFLAIESFIDCEMTDQNDYIIEWYHIEPELVQRLDEKYPGKIQSIFLIKTDPEKFLQDLRKSSTPNDWIIARTHNDETFWKIAYMITQYGMVLSEEAQIQGMRVINMDNSFTDNLKIAMLHFSTKE